LNSHLLQQRHQNPKSYLRCQQHSTGDVDLYDATREVGCCRPTLKDLSRYREMLRFGLIVAYRLPNHWTRVELESIEGVV
jgi:hypothetical protein